MNKKVFTLLPIFSLFALASCGGAGGSGTQYCLVDFDSDGGTHVSAMKIAVGTKIESVDSPTKTGYTFGGWTKDGVKFEFPATINEDTTLKATWTGGPTPTNPCTLTYHFNNAPGGGSEQTYVETYEQGAKPTKPDWEPTYDAEHVFGGWYNAQIGGSEFDFNATLTATDTPVYAHWNPAPSPEKSASVSQTEFKNAVTLAFDKDFVTNKYVGGTVTSSTGGTHNITAVTEDGTSTGKWKFTITGYAIPQDLLNAARVESLSTAVYHTIYYIGDSYQTGIITGFSYRLSGDTYRYNNHCVITQWATETFTYTLNDTPSNL